MIDDLGQHLLRYNFNQKYMVFDFETNALNMASPNINLPWNLGYNLFEGKKLIHSKEILLKWPDYKIDNTVALINGFNQEVYERDAVDPVKPLNRFNNLLNREDIYLITANGFSFDMYVNNLALRQLGLAENFSYLHRLICIQNLAKAEHLKIKMPKIGTDDWVAKNMALTNWYDFKFKCSLGVLSKKYEVTYDENKHHKSSVYDVELTKQIFDKQIGKIEI